MTPTSPSAAIAWPSPARHEAFERWFATIAPSHGLDRATLRPASSDASFRRYFRVDTAAGSASFIVMDAPPPQEDVRPFCDIAGRLAAAGLNAPRVVERQDDEGFLLLTDLGSRLYLAELQQAVDADDIRRRDALMADATRALIRWQTAGDATGLPAYDAVLLRRELELFPEWCVGREFGGAWSAAERASWDEVTEALIASALAQPTVPVHRDYMPRNLMRVEPTGEAVNPGILDFQDAVRGPVAYDVASLLRDAFISWEEDVELDWAVRYWTAARKAGLELPDDFGEFWRQVEWTGLQRHLKVLGIFCRLKHRDAKPAYAADLPRFFRYAHKVANRYRTLRPLVPLLEPLMGEARIEVFY